MPIFSYTNTFKSTFELVDSEVVKVCYTIQNQHKRLSSEFMFSLEYVLRETLNNAVEHGNNMDADKNVGYLIEISGKDVYINIWDDGGGFDLEDILQTVKNDDEIGIRQRGLKSIVDLGFKIGINEKHICMRSKIEEKEDTMISIANEKEKVILKVGVNLVAPNIKALIGEINPVVDGLPVEVKVILLDLAETKSIDSMGITFLVGLLKTSSAKGKKLKLANVSSTILKLFKVMKLDSFFEIE